MCFYCGEIVKTTNQPTQNRYTRHVKPTKFGDVEDVEFAFTDHVASELAPFVAGQLLGRQIPQRSASVRPADVYTSPPKALIQDTQVEQQEPQQEEPQPSVVHQSSAEEGAIRFFRRDNETLIAISRDFKGSNWAEQQRRFVILFASAYEQLFGKHVSDDEQFKIAAKNANIYDQANFAKHLKSVVQQHLTHGSTGYFVNNDGKKRVDEIIAEMDNPQVPPGDPYWNRSQTDTTQRHRLSKSRKELIQGWAEEEVDLGHLEIITIKSGRDYALLAFWILITRLKKGECFLWNEAYEYLTVKYKAISASSEKFSRAVRSEPNAELFRKSEEAYFLTQEANSIVESWVAGTSKPGADNSQ